MPHNTAAAPTPIAPTKITALGRHYLRVAQNVAALAARSGPFQSAAQDIVQKLAVDYTDLDTMMAVMHTAQDLDKIETAGLGNDAAFHTALGTLKRRQWQNFTAPPAAADLQNNLAAKLYNVKNPQTDVATITLGHNTRLVGQWLVRKAIADGVEFHVDFSEPDFAALVTNHTDEDGIARMGARFLESVAAVTTRIGAYSGQADDEQISPDPAKSKTFAKIIAPYGERVRSGQVFFTITDIPTPHDAKIDGIAYDDYIKLFFEMCDQPWDEIDKAQQALIAELNAAKSLRFTNNDGTDISMDIDGFTFCNSLIAKNVPGSEVFSAPKRDSVNGTIVAKGRFSPPRGNGIIENLTLTFNNGKLVSYKADKGVEHFEKEINVDEGARWIGEIGIGTNPHLKTHVANGLLVEKIGGSFHLALGACYTMKEYQGVPVNVDNGNQSALHWDVTTMLHGKGGRMYVDGRLIMDDGKFLDPRYDVFNRGWAAIREDKRPQYWRDYYKNSGPSAP